MSIRRRKGAGTLLPRNMSAILHHIDPTSHASKIPQMTICAVRIPIKALAAKIQYVLPDQAGAGVHTNITAAALLKSGPNKAEAMRFLEFLLSDEAQGYFANLTNEFPIVETVPLPEALADFGTFKVAPIDARAYGAFQPDAQKTYDRAGWR